MTVTPATLSGSPASNTAIATNRRPHARENDRATHTASVLRRLAHELDSHGLRVRPGGLRAAQKLFDGRPTLVPVVARELVHIHLDEAVRRLFVEVAGEPERIRGRLLAMLEARADRVAQHLRQLVNSRNISPRGVDAQWKRQPGLEQPPLAKIEHLDQALVGIRELPLVD